MNNRILNIIQASPFSIQLNICIYCCIKLKYIGKCCICIPSSKRIPQPCRVIWSNRNLSYPHVSRHRIRAAICIVCNPFNLLNNWIKINIAISNRHTLSNALRTSLNQCPSSQGLIASHFDIHIHDTNRLTRISLLNLSD